MKRGLGVIVFIVLAITSCSTYNEVEIDHWQRMELIELDIYFKKEMKKCGNDIACIDSLYDDVIAKEDKILSKNIGSH